MSKLRNLPEVNVLNPGDLFYLIDSSAGPNGGRKITTANFKSAISLTAAEVKNLYESNADTNAFTDAEKTKLASVESGATADQNASEVPFDNTGTDLAASEVESAIKEVNVKAQADFRPSIVSGRILKYTGGTVRFDGVFFQVLSNDILLDQNITNGEVYVDLDGTVKQTGSGVLAPPYTVVFARFSTNLTDIISLTDERVKNAQNIVRGILADVRDVRAGASASEGASGRVSDAMHKHNILTASPIAQPPNQANAEGNAIELARANHVHQIPTAAPSATLTPASTNAEGAGVAFARDTHSHAHAMALDADVSAILPNDTAATGVLDKFAKAAHKHAISTAAPATTLAPSSANAEGAGNDFARASHVHQFAISLDADVSTILPNDTAAIGAVDKFAKAAHKHAIATAAPATTLAPSSANAEGAGNNFARSTHVHQFAIALDADISTILPNDTAATGAVDKFAKAAHKHAIATAAPVALTPNQANAEGAGNNFARASHVHNVPTAAPPTNMKPSSFNADGAAATFAKSDHGHAFDMAVDADVSTILPNDAAATGAVDKFSKAGHKHAIATATAVALSTSSASAEGAGNNFARATHTHAISITNQEVTATADDTATSLTDILMNSMTVTPAAGTYLVIWSGSIVNSANGAERSWVSLYSAGSQVSATERSIGTAGGGYSPAFTQAIITVNGSQAIELRWRVAGGTSTVHSRRLTLAKLA